ncbi:MAG: PilN domain-containing protein [Thermoanaerobaculia bacterium]
MIRINLLREGRGAARAAVAAPGVGAAAPGNRNLVVMVAIIVIGLLAGGGWTFVKWRQVEAKEVEVADAEAEAERLRKIIEEVERFEARKKSLENRIALINQLKQNQKGPVRLLDHVSRDLPDLVWLDRMTLSGRQITIAGQTLNPNAAATFVENIKSDAMFDEPQFNVLAASRSDRGNDVYRFDMRFNFRYLEQIAAEGEAGSGEAAEAGADPQG